MKEKKKWSAEQVLTLAVLGFLAVLFLFNLHLLYSPVKKLVKGETDFETFTQEVQYTYTNNTIWKTPFVNLNGLFARLTGQRVCNEVIRLNNGMLCDQQPLSTNIYPPGNELVRFNNYLKEKGIPFLYVQAPYKVDLASELLPEGVVNYSNDDATQFIQGVSEYGVHVLDLRPTFSGNGELVGENFFRTDHHWTFTAALRAFPMLLEEMDGLLPERELDKSCAEFDRWEAHTLEDWFLGTWGRRTGIFYGGVDDLTYYTPKFSTQMSRALPLGQAFYSGDYIQANLNMDYAREKDYFGSSPYCICADGDQPLVEHRNAAAANKLKVLLIQDSFGLPIECYFSTAFTQVDVLDPRFDLDYTDSVMEYVNNTKPDMVVMMITTTGLSERCYSELGVDQEWMRERAAAGTEREIFRADAAVSGGEDGEGRCEVPADLEPGKRYTFRCDGIRVEEGTAPGVMAILRNQEDNYVKGEVFDVEYGNETGGFSWSFNVPADQTGPLHLYLYPGIPDNAAGVRLTYVNASVTCEE